MLCSAYKIYAEILRQRLGEEATKTEILINFNPYKILIN